jgi:hypothetical protein
MRDSVTIERPTPDPYVASAPGPLPGPQVGFYVESTGPTFQLLMLPDADVQQGDHATVNGGRVFAVTSVVRVRSPKRVVLTTVGLSPLTPS